MWQYIEEHNTYHITALNHTEVNLLLFEVAVKYMNSKVEYILAAATHPQVECYSNGFHCFQLRYDIKLITVLNELWDNLYG